MFFMFLCFNVGYAQSHSVHWTQEYDQEVGLHAGASIPWGNEAEIFIIAILGGKLAFLGENKCFCQFRGGRKCKML